MATKEISLEQVKKSYINKTSKSYRLKLFNKKWPFYTQKDLEGDYDVQHTLHQLQITKLFPLPFGIEKEMQVGYVPYTYTLTEEEAKDRLLSWLWEDISSQLGDEATVLKREAFFRTSEGKVTGSLYIIAEESIGYEVGIDQQLTNEGEQINDEN